MPLRGRYLHTMIHVADLERSIDFYTRIMGMSVLRRGEMPAERRRNAFVGYGAEDETAVLELTAFHDRDHYNAGDAFGHFALGFADVRLACAAIAAAGGNVSTQPYVIASGKTVAFVTDPDGYAIELVQPAPA
jgi:lactoylglutathione lyase